MNRVLPQTKSILILFFHFLLTLKSPLLKPFTNEAFSSYARTRADLLSCCCWCRFFQWMSNRVRKIIIPSSARSKQKIMNHPRNYFAQQANISNSKLPELSPSAYSLSKHIRFLHMDQSRLLFSPSKFLWQSNNISSINFNYINWTQCSGFEPRPQTDPMECPSAEKLFQGEN